MRDERFGGTPFPLDDDDLVRQRISPQPSGFREDIRRKPPRVPHGASARATWGSGGFGGPAIWCAQEES